MARSGTVRTPDDDAGDLLGPLDFSDEEPPEAPVQRSGGGRAVRLLLVLALLAAGGVAAVRWQRDGDVRSVLASSGATYLRAVQQVELAADASQLASGAGLATRSADRLDADLRRLRSTSGGRRAAVAAQVAAERDVVRALAGLTDVATTPLPVWGRVQPVLSAAVAAEGLTRDRLRDHDAGSARALPDTTAMLSRVGEAVGRALVEDVQRSGNELLDGLAQAQRTADLRSAGEGAGPQRTAVLAARQGLGPSSGAQVLDEFASALLALQDLRGVTPAQTLGWAAVRTALDQHLGFVGRSADSLSAGSLRARLPLVLSAVDAVVARAADAQAAWQPVHDAAVAQQAADTGALQRYHDDVHAALTDAAQTRAAVVALLAVPGLGTDAAAARLAPLSAAVSSAADRVRTEPVPASVGPAHAALLARLDALAGPLAAAVQELTTTACRACPASATPSWAVLRAAGNGSWDAQAAALDAAITDATAAVAARQLPPPPDA